MNIELLKKKLDALGVPRQVYSLGGWRDERVCIENRNGMWIVFFVERGEERLLRSFSEEADACNFMLDELRREV